MIVGHLLDIVHTMNIMDAMDGNLDVKHVDSKMFIHIVFYRTRQITMYAK